MIFIVGNSRSGTTMLGRMIGRHSQVYTFEELHFFEQMVSAEEISTPPSWARARLKTMLERLLTSARSNIFRSVEPGRYGAEAETILDTAASDDPVAVYDAFLAFETARHDKQIPCEQTPRYLYLVDELLDRYPQARFICMVRDPRSVLLSQKNKWRRRKIGKENMPFFWAARAWVNYHPYMTTLLWASASRNAQSLQDHPRVLCLRFEDLLRNPEAQTRQLCNHLDLQFEPDMLEVSQIGSSLDDDQPDKRGVDASKLDSWQRSGLSNAEIALCEQLACEEMQHWGYASSGRQSSALHRIGLMAGFVIKSILALFLNLRRFKNLPQTLRRRFG